MTEFVWVLTETVVALHGEQLAEHGGRDGIRDKGLLESALARPRNMAAYEGCQDIATLAAAYAYGIARDHPFADGNKRAAFVTAELFLVLNGFQLTAADADCLLAMVALADGALSEEDLVEWFQENRTPL